jgi:hypothetical protein
MPTFIFDDNFSQNEKRILAKCCKTHVTELGIHDRDCTVTIKKTKLPSDIDAQMGSFEPGYFAFEINSKGYHLSKAISSLGHELVHLRQFLLGHMKGDDQGGCFWKGQHIPNYICQCGLFYRDLPWEQEAWELQPKLHAKAIKNLPYRDKFAVAANAADHNQDNPFVGLGKI